MHKLNCEKYRSWAKSYTESAVARGKTPTFKDGRLTVLPDDAFSTLLNQIREGKPAAVVNKKGESEAVFLKKEMMFEAVSGQRVISYSQLRENMKMKGAVPQYFSNYAKLLFDPTFVLVGFHNHPSELVKLQAAVKECERLVVVLDCEEDVVCASFKYRKLRCMPGCPPVTATREGFVLLDWPAGGSAKVV